MMTAAKAERVKTLLTRLRHPEQRRQVRQAIEALADGVEEPAELLLRWRWLPVRIDEFIESHEYMNLRDQIWSKRVMDDLVEAAHGDYTQVIFTGAIGSAKTFSADLLEAYEIYLMTCLAHPHADFGLSPHTPIVFVAQSVTEKAAKRVLYDFLSSVIRNSDYFQRVCPLRTDLRSEVRFINENILLSPVASLETAAIGENVAGFLMDEANFRQVVVGSARAPWLDTYDAAVQSWNALSSRMRSRFLKRGRLPGKMIGISSSRYPEDFTERKMAEAEKQVRETGQTDIFVACRSVWSVKPADTYRPGTFRLFVGRGLARSRILRDGETPKDEGEILEVPTDLRPDFEQDMERAVREVAGRPTRAIHAFIARREKIAAAISRTDRPHAFTMLETTLRDGVGLVLEAFDDVDLPRAAHLDLAVTRDACGLAIGYVLKSVGVERTVHQVQVARAEGRGEDIEEIETHEGTKRIERAPYVVVEAMLQIVAPPNDEIMLEDVVNLLCTIRDLGIPIEMVTADTYQSVAPLQMLRDRGILTGVQSVDTDPDPYENLKSAFYDDRIEMFGHPVAIRELASLEKNEKTGRVDHPRWAVDLEGAKVKGSKDVADALAGMVHILSRRRDSWRRGSPRDSGRRHVQRVRVVRK